MNDLKNSNLGNHSIFKRGVHFNYRTNQFWSSLCYDLVIEQTLMESLKTSRGLTHGSKMTEEQQTLWTLSATIMFDYNITIQDLNEIIFIACEQHKY